MRKFVLMAIAAMLPFGAEAARLTLRDGTVIFGNFETGTTQSIIFRDNHGVRRRFNTNEVLTLDFNVVSTVSNGYDPQVPPPHPVLSNDQNGANRYMPGAQPTPEWAVLSSGTQIAVRNDESINSQNASEGRTYPATIQQDVLDASGNIVIPRGSQAQLVIRQVNQGGALNNGNFILDLDSVRVNGRRYLVSTSDLEARDRNGIGANRRTGEMVGGGAVLGTLLGAIAGGGKGAAIGALAGAAAGGGVEVLTKGHEIRVPAETVLTFRLDQPLRLREAQ